MLKKTIIALAFLSLATSSEAAQVRSKTDAGKINASQPAAGDGINYHDKNLHNYQDPYLTNDRAYKSNENGEAAPAPKSNNIIIPPTYREEVIFVE